MNYTPPPPAGSPPGTVEEESVIINYGYKTETVWKSILKDGIKYEENIFVTRYVNKISENNEHILGFIFSKLRITNKESHHYFKINTNFNYKLLLKQLKKIDSKKIIEPPLVTGMKGFEIINKKIKLDKEDWKKIIDITSVEEQSKIIPRLIEELHNLAYTTKENKINFISMIVEPWLESVSAHLTEHAAQSLLNSIVDLILKEQIPRIKDSVIKQLIEKSETNYVLQYLLEYDRKSVELKKPNYLNYISKENVELIIDRIDDKHMNNNIYVSYGYDHEDNYKVEKELRNKVYQKVLKEPEDYIKVYLNVKDTGWNEDFINKKIKEISEKPSKCEDLLKYWISGDGFDDTVGGLEKSVKNKDQNIKNHLTNEHISLLVNGLSNEKNKIKESGWFHDKKMNENEIGYQLLTKIREKELYKYNIEIPYLKDLLNKYKETNEYLLDFYLDQSFNGILRLKEEELINYVNHSKTNTYKSSFLNKCFNLEDKNYAKRGSLLSFALDLADIDNENQLKSDSEFQESIELIQDWFFEIKNNKDSQYITERLFVIDIANIIKNQKLLNVLGSTVLSSISKIEDIWKYTVNKNDLINSINFNEIDFTYKDIKEIKKIPIEKAIKGGLEIYDHEIYKLFNKNGSIICEINKSNIYTELADKKKRNALISIPSIDDFNIWNVLIKQQNKQYGKKTFSNENIKEILSKIDINDKFTKVNLIKSLFYYETEGFKFMKELIKEDEQTFERLIKNILKKIEDTDEMTNFTKKLLEVKAEAEFSEELVLEAYNKSDKTKIDSELIKKAQIIKLMEDAELNNIDIANKLVRKSKNNFYKLGNQLIEFLQLDADNSENILNKYSEENTKGILNIFKRKEKEQLQNKINEAIKYNESQQIEPTTVIKEVKKINLKNLRVDEIEKIEEILTALESINKDKLKSLLLVEKSELKNCMEKTFIRTIKNYSKINESEKKESLDLSESFKEIMDYCLEQINAIINKNKDIKLKPQI